MRETRKEWLDKIIDLHEKINGARFDNDLEITERVKSIQLNKGIFLLAAYCDCICKSVAMTSDEWCVEFFYRNYRIFQFIKGDVIANV